MIFWVEKGQVSQQFHIIPIFNNTMLNVGYLSWTFLATVYVITHVDLYDWLLYLNTIIYILVFPCWISKHVHSWNYMRLFYYPLTTFKCSTSPNQLIFTLSITTACLSISILIYLFLYTIFFYNYEL